MNEPKVWEIVNEDGTPFDPPKNPLMEKWLKEHPPTPMPQFSQVCDGYSCMYCGRCPYGEYWKIPDEDKEAWEEYSKQHEEYINAHNPSHKALIEKYGQEVVIDE